MRNRRSAVIAQAAIFACALGLAAAPTFGQSNDGNFRGWSFYEDLGAPRAAGMAGAFVAVADDASAAAINPAGLLSLTKTELQLGVVHRGAGVLPSGDTSARRTSAGFAGGAGHLSNRLAIGAYVTEPHDLRLTLAQPAGGLDAGYLESTVTDAGVAAAWAVSPRLHVGARLNVTHLRLRGALSHAPSDPGGFFSATAAAQDRVAGDAGVLYQISRRAAVGVSFAQGARWNATRTAETATGEPLATIAYQVSSPSRLKAGFAIRPNPRLLLAAEADYVLLSRLEDTLAPVLQPAARSDYALKNAVDQRAGFEVALPTRGSVSVQVRAGLVSLAPAALRFEGVVLPPQGSAFPGDGRHLLATAGASLNTRTIHFDVAASFGGERTVVTAGTGVRF